MNRVCAHCGEMYPEERPNCPHCGADADLTYSSDEYSPELGLETPEEQDDEEYTEFLEREGLGSPRTPRRAGCLVLLAAPLLALLLL